MASHNQATETERLKRWQRAKDWHNDGNVTTQTSSRH
jgi:hypothetical protein